MFCIGNFYKYTLTYIWDVSKETINILKVLKGCSIDYSDN